MIGYFHGQVRRVASIQIRIQIQRKEGDFYESSPVVTDQLCSYIESLPKPNKSLAGTDMMYAPVFVRPRDAGDGIKVRILGPEYNRSYGASFVLPDKTAYHFLKKLDCPPDPEPDEEQSEQSEDHEPEEDEPEESNEESPDANDWKAMHAKDVAFVVTKEIPSQHALGFSTHSHIHVGDVVLVSSTKWGTNPHTDGGLLLILRKTLTGEDYTPIYIGHDGNVSTHKGCCSTGHWWCFQWKKVLKPYTKPIDINTVLYPNQWMTAIKDIMLIDDLLFEKGWSWKFVPNKTMSLEFCGYICSPDLEERHIGHSGPEGGGKKESYWEISDDNLKKLFANSIPKEEPNE